MPTPILVAQRKDKFVIPEYIRKNFDTLSYASDDMATYLLEVKEKETGKIQYAICAVSIVDGEARFTPLAAMIEENPFEKYLPPNPGGGFIGE